MTAIAAALTRRDVTSPALLTELCYLRSAAAGVQIQDDAELSAVGRLRLSIAHSLSARSQRDERPVGSALSFFVWLVICTGVPWAIAHLLFQHESDVYQTERRRRLRARLRQRRVDDASRRIEMNNNDDDDDNNANDRGGDDDETGGRNDGVPGVVRYDARGADDMWTNVFGADHSLRARFGAMTGVCLCLLMCVSPRVRAATLTVFASRAVAASSC